MNFRQHVQSDRAKWAVVTVAILALAVLITGLMTSWFKDFNPYCWFGHTYDEETHVCTKCGAEEPEETEDETVTTESVIVYDFAAVKTNTLGDTPSVSTMMAVQPLAADSDFSWTKLTSNGDLSIQREGTIGSGYFLFNFKIDATQVFMWDLSVKTSGGQSVYSYSVPMNLLDNRYSLDVDSLYSNGTLQKDVEYTVYLNIAYTKSGGQMPTDFLMEDVCSFMWAETPVVSELPDPPTKTGYTFTGWYTDAACTKPYTEDKVIGDITLYAGFRANTYTIVFNANTGSGTMSNQSMTYDTAANLTANTFTKDKYTFKGWATSAGGSVEYADGQSVKNLTATDGATINLYAVWELNSYTVSFVVDGETTSTINVNIDAAATLPEEPSKEGYNFIGWFLEDGTQYTNQAITADTVLTAKFEIIKCTVTFIVDGEVYARYECDYGTNLSELLSQNVNTLLYSVEGEYSPNF